MLAVLVVSGVSNESFSLLPKHNVPWKKGVLWFPSRGQDQTLLMCFGSGTRSPGTVVLVVPGSPG